MPLSMLLGMALSLGAAETVPYGIDQWPEAYGNHRARIRVAAQADAIYVRLPWRRRDTEPEKKNIVVVDAATGHEIKNLVRLSVAPERGELVFQPQTAPGEYYVYYMPYALSGWTYMPSLSYGAVQSSADPEWVGRQDLSPGRVAELPSAQVLEFQALSDFHRFDPMEAVASEEEIKALLSGHPESCLVFPEDRRNPVKMRDNLPLRWIQNGPSRAFSEEALRGEFYVFQIGLYAARKSLENLAVRFGGLKGESGSEIPASAFRCINTGGVDWAGRPFTQPVDIEEGQVGSLWIGVQVPEEAKPGLYRGEIEIAPANAESAHVHLSIKISPQAMDKRTDNEIWRHTRLRWLDSTLAVDEEVTAPYTPLQARGRSVKCLGREVRYGVDGLPTAIRSGRQDILARPVRWVIEAEGGPVAWQKARSKTVSKTPGSMVWESAAEGDGLVMASRAKMEYDGHIAWSVTFKAEKDIALRDIRLELPFRKESAAFMMGMGRKGGLRPQAWNWKWNKAKHQDAAWIGSVHAGLHLKLKGPDYRRPLINIYYAHLPILPPEGWDNGGRGGCSLTENGEEVLFSAFSGERTLRVGQEARFDFDLQVTPVRPIDYAAHWNTRYYHSSEPPENAVRARANVINLHHGSELNPYINYPFLAAGRLKAYIDRAHGLGLKAKIYYTVREMTNHVREIFALRSLGTEIYADGPGGGASWLQEHLQTGYIPAWYQPLGDREGDAAIINTPLSRWHNYYLEGLAWLIENVGIDGLYIDDVSYDRDVMKRVRKVLDRMRPGSLIDLHSWNHFNDRAGWINCALLYMELFPYLDSIWFGEGFDYNESPDFWLVEVSGIPFGLMGEMLEGGGNPWRGMLYGMTSRVPWSQEPPKMWAAWDSFGIARSRMIGYWEPECPVKTDRADVPVTAYVRKGKTLVSLASWASGPVDARLRIDWKALGILPEKASLHAPAIANFQPERRFDPNGPIPVEPGKGWLIVIGEADE
ncbi:MAG: hypothetical protein IT210_05265 [Armatimonadetes bacterium]|nr:hypothetical protein [Armatimonadota bacterium]